MTAPRFQVVRGGRLLDIAGHKADFSDILIEGDVIREIGAPGMAVPEDGYLVPNDAPGFGIELTLDDIERAVS